MANTYFATKEEHKTGKRKVQDFKKIVAEEKSFSGENQG
jgi:hypothetical protein